MGMLGQQLAHLLQQHQRGRPQRRRWARQRRVRAAEASALSAAPGSSHMSFAIQICIKYRIGWVDQTSIIENKFDCNTPGTGEKACSNGDFEPIMLA